MTLKECDLWLQDQLNSRPVRRPRVEAPILMQMEEACRADIDLCADIAIEAGEVTRLATRDAEYFLQLRLLFAQEIVIAMMGKHSPFLRKRIAKRDLRWLLIGCWADAGKAIWACREMDIWEALRERVLMEKN